MEITQGARVWVQTLTGQPAAPRWEDGHEATAVQIHADRQIPMITARDAEGREITVLHYESFAGFECRGNANWVPETEPRVLDWLESEVRKGFKRSECGSLDRYNESRMARNREILRRNGRRVAVESLA